LAIWALYALFKNAKKNSSSSANNTTSNRSPKPYTPVNRTSSSGKPSSNEDEVVDIAIATGLAYHTLFKDTDGDTDLDKDDWDNDDDMYYMYGDNNDVNDFDKDEWGDEW